MRTRGLEVCLLLAALIIVSLPVHGLGLFAYDDPVRESTMYHGIAHEGTEDDWSTICAPVVTDHQLILSVHSLGSFAGLDARLAIHAEDVAGSGGVQTVSAIAEPGEPATLEITSPCSSPSFTVEALSVDGATNYTVECTGGCGSDPPSPPP